jgi:hypothetical protein
MPDRLDYQLLPMRNDEAESANESKLNQLAEVKENFGPQRSGADGVNCEGPM